MKPAFPVPSAINASLVLPLLPIFLLGAAILSGGKKTLVAEAARRDLTQTLAAREAAPRGLPYGKFAVTRTRDVLFQDTRRGKDIPVTVTAPSTGGPFPVIVYSHGAGGDGTQNESLLRWWASHGYIVISPTHSDSIRWQQRRSDLCSPEGAEGEEGNLGLQSIIRLAERDPQAGVQRARDISFVLNSLCALEEKIPSLAGQIDHEHVGVGGNSLGAYAAQLVGGATISVPGMATPLSFRDIRVRAVVQFSGQGSGQQGLTRESWKRVTIPMMTVTGSEDRGANGHGLERKKEPFVLSPSTGGKYHVFIEGANHNSFAGRFGGRRRWRDQPAPDKGKKHAADQRAIFCYIEQTTLAFWDSTLKGDAAAKTLLDSQEASLARQRSVVATLDHK